MRVIILILILFSGCGSEPIIHQEEEESVFAITIRYDQSVDVNPPIQEHIPDVVYRAMVLEVVYAEQRMININGQLRQPRVNDRLLFDFTDYVPNDKKGAITDFKGFFYVRAGYNVQTQRMAVTEANRFKYLIIKHPSDK